MKNNLTELQKEKLIACIVGCAVGDAVGLPFEGMKPTTIAKVLKDKPVRHCLIGGYGMWSDDTDHSVMLVQSVLEQSSPEAFTKSFSRKLRLWFLTLPPGIGLGTVCAIFKSFFGMKHPGVYSAGNGPCMRAASLGVIFKDDPAKLAEYNQVQTKLTHTDPKAQIASRSIVEIASHLIDSSLNIDLLEELITKESDAEWSLIVSQMICELREGKTPDEFMKGTTLIHLGGDTDTCCAIAGSLCGIAHGMDTIPELWKSNIKEFPVSFTQLNHVADQKLFRKRDLPLRFIRNICQLILVLIHGFGRMAPITLKKHFY